MSEYNEIYQEIILDHNKSPRNFMELKDANRHAEGYNPLCGDQVTVQLKVKDHVVEEIAFQGQGCAICVASASIMTQTVKGKSLEASEGIISRFQHFMTAKECPLVHEDFDLEKLEVFKGVREYPMRIKCATLPWHTCRAALHGEDQPVSTE